MSHFSHCIAWVVSGAIHLWRPHGGVGLRWTHVDREEGGSRPSSPMWTSTQKIKISPL